MAPDPISQPELRILHRGPRYCVRQLCCTPDPFAVICFEYWLPSPSLDAEFAAERFFAHRRMNAIGILAARNDWFQNAEILAVIDAIRRATDGWHLVGYGGSMGAYAAINFADMLRLRSIIAVCPQYSIDHARAPYEPRWRDEAADIEADGGFTFDRIDRAPRLDNGWLIFDPGCVDRQHAADIQRFHALGELRLRFAGHEMMRMLQQADMFTPMLLDMLEGRFDLATYRTAWRAARRRSATYWLGVAAEMRRRGNPAAAARAMAAARALPHPDQAEIDVEDARICLDAGDLAAARALATPWVAHPAWGEAARACLAGCAPREPAAPEPEPSGPRPTLLASLRRFLRG
jgi:hypothetical protein